MEYITEMFQELNRMRKQGNFCDTLIKSNGGEIHPVHSCILSAASPMLSQCILNKEEIILDLDAKDILVLLDILYSGTIPIGCNYETLLRICKEFDMKSISNLLSKNFPNQVNENEIDGLIPKRKRGRPRKIKDISVISQLESDKVKRKVGRPKKSEVIQTDTDVCRIDEQNGDSDANITRNKRFLPERKSRGKRPQVWSEMFESLDDIDCEYNPKKSANNTQSSSDLVDSKTKISVENNLAKIDENTRESENSKSKLLDEWKKCQYCSQFKGRKRGRYEFHINFCHLPLKCPLCFKPFINQQDADTHVCHLVKTSLPQCVCEICGKTVVGKYSLKVHLNIHRNIKNFKCPQCPKKFVRKLQLDSHIKHLHNQSRPFNCQLCKSKFAYNFELKRHMLRHSGHKCPQCPKFFRNLDDLKSHAELKQCRVYRYPRKNSRTIKNLKKDEKDALANNPDNSNSNIDLEELKLAASNAVTFVEHLQEENTSLIPTSDHPNSVYMCQLCEAVFSNYDGVSEHFKNGCPADSNNVVHPTNAVGTACVNPTDAGTTVEPVNMNSFNFTNIDAANNLLYNELKTCSDVVVNDQTDVEYVIIEQQQIGTDLLSSRTLQEIIQTNIGE